MKRILALALALVASVAFAREPNPYVQSGGGGGTGTGVPASPTGSLQTNAGAGNFGAYGGTSACSGATPYMGTLSSAGVATCVPASTVVNHQVGTTYTVVTGDQGKLVTLNNAAAVAVTLPQAGSAGFAANWETCFANQGAGTATVTPTTSNIDGQTSLALTQFQGACVFSDGTNYASVRGLGTGGSSAFSSLTGGTNTAAAMVVGTGASLGASGSGTITATAAPLSGISGLGTSVASALAVNRGTSGGLMTQNGTHTAGDIAQVDGSGGIQDSGIAASGLSKNLVNAQQALGTTAIASGACATVITITATGLTTSGHVYLTYAATPVGVTGYDPSVTTGGLRVTGYPTANTVNISVCNPTASSITPAAMTVNVQAFN